ncbi:hypothetical protein SERLA73DRAFT_111513 [Serpula lacrymans var. lacrymans S7.3]|uniref:Sorting nexin MVP1 n=2 Tax=Serpula lacrymans var. lacrymans TaxID=341189 RepID=F8Q3U8_SERL3|nr:uncharacterized protein SERLADRAFT_473162 [Serpula lacrymans var. lacrymans S7.9]EGN96804.1 hypothetical protein SERLA73DRAFT_111513 [Serpula lacrymans var. lacrymans S7.3]EGO22403.1 hypothetical protein SERLADRAFT_473162 [Serpula lacrymans var. lacrymans S7.9]
MFNAPRPAQRYGSTSNGFGGSFVAENPLSASVYDGLDPWSAAPTPSPPPISSLPSTFSSVIADASIPAIYHKAFSAADTSNSGETSVNALSRVLATSSLPAATVDRIVNLVSSRPRVSKLEFYIALALVALAQSGRDISIEQVAAAASQNNLPEPSLNLESLQPSTSAFTTPYPNYRQNSGPPLRSPAPAYASEDPWSASRFGGAGEYNDTRTIVNGAPSTVSGSGLPKDWWKKQEAVNIAIQGQQGFILNRYTVYEISTDRGAAVHRRYSEFVFLWDCLVRRYPFRLLPALPPKRVQPDEAFLEQRRKGLIRFLNFVINHPVIKEDGLLAVFLTEPSLETWRKHSSVSLDEESVSKRIDHVEEMTIPSDLEEKLTSVRSKISPLIEQWQRICILAERIIKRREAAAVRIPSSLRRTYLPAHFAFSLFPSPLSSAASTHTSDSDTSAFYEQADIARLTNVLKVVAEVNETCWRGDDCELCDGVRQGVGQVATHMQRQSDMLEQQTRTLLYRTLESLKSQRDLYMAMRDLFIRHDRLSVDNVERLKKRVDTNSLKMEGIKAAQKDGWQEEADRIIGIIEKDQATIASLLSRRVFIRASMWHELRVVLHNRENALITQAVQAFARDEQSFTDSVLANWISLGNAVEGMPFE